VTHPLVSSTLGYNKLTSVETSIRADTKLEPPDIYIFLAGYQRNRPDCRLCTSTCMVGSWVTR
jgi:hypothetical protein